MNEILQTIIENLVEDKSKVSIKEIAGEKSLVFEIRVAENDMGKIIGKKGRIASSIRTIMKAIAAKEGKKVNIEFIG